MNFQAIDCTSHGYAVCQAYLPARIEFHLIRNMSMPHADNVHHMMIYCAQSSTLPNDGASVLASPYTHSLIHPHFFPFPAPRTWLCSLAHCRQQFPLISSEVPNIPLRRNTFRFSNNKHPLLPSSPEKARVLRRFAVNPRDLDDARVISLKCIPRLSTGLSITIPAEACRRVLRPWPADIQKSRRWLQTREGRGY